MTSPGPPSSWPRPWGCATEVPAWSYVSNRSIGRRCAAEWPTSRLVPRSPRQRGDGHRDGSGAILRHAQHHRPRRPRRAERHGPEAGGFPDWDRCGDCRHRNAHWWMVGRPIWPEVGKGARALTPGRCGIALAAGQGGGVCWLRTLEQHPAPAGEPQGQLTALPRFLHGRSPYRNRAVNLWHSRTGSATNCSVLATRRRTRREVHDTYTRR